MQTTNFRAKTCTIPYDWLIYRVNQRFRKAPHLLYPSVLDDLVPEERQAGIEMGLTLLYRCDELWTFGPTVSNGMQAEIAEAERLRIPVRRMDVPEMTMEGPAL